MPEKQPKKEQKSEPTLNFSLTYDEVVERANMIEQDNDFRLFNQIVRGEKLNAEYQKLASWLIQQQSQQK